MWNSVIHVAKSVMTSQQALQKCTDLLKDGRNMLDSLGQDAVAVESLHKEISKVRLFMDAATNLDNSEEQKRSAMLQLRDEITEKCDEKFPASEMDKFATWLAGQFQEQQLGFGLSDMDAFQKFAPALQIRGLTCDPSQ